MALELTWEALQTPLLERKIPFACAPPRQRPDGVHRHVHSISGIHPIRQRNGQRNFFCELPLSRNRPGENRQLKRGGREHFGGQIHGTFRGSLSWGFLEGVKQGNATLVGALMGAGTRGPPCGAT